MTAYADTILLSTPTAADVTILFREGTAHRILRWMWNVSAPKIADAGRGTVWICRAWLAKHLGVSRGALRQALCRLRRMRWIADAVTTDSDGQLCEGFAFAKRADQGFGDAGETLARRSRDAGETLERRSYTIVKTKLIESTDQTAMSRKPRQTDLTGVGFEAPTQPAQVTQPRTKAGNMKRDSRLHDIAVRVDDYERDRYEQHPRCVRPKRTTPEARVLSVGAITQALERVVATEVYPTLEDIEMRFRAVVELNWDSAERKVETWDWWTGSAMWTPLSLERCLGWLDEHRNEVYLLRARGVLALPQRATSEAPSPADMTGLSPLEQQAEYDRQFGAAAEHVEDYVRETSQALIQDAKPEQWGTPEWMDEAYWKLKECSDFVVGVDLAKPGSDEAGVHIEYRDGLGKEDLRKVHDDAAEQLSDAIDRGDAQGLDDLVRELMDYTGQPADDVSETQLARDMRAKTAYVNGTSAEERAADAEAGRKPWEVG